MSRRMSIPMQVYLRRCRCKVGVVGIYCRGRRVVSMMEVGRGDVWVFDVVRCGLV